MHPYKFSVKLLVDFEKSCYRVNPEVVVSVTFQDRVGDAPIHLAIQIFSHYLKNRHPEGKKVA